MKFIKLTGLGFALLLFTVFIAGFLLPQTAHVERSVIVAKPKHEVFNFLSDFRNFTQWSPWHDLDPDTQYNYIGPRTGVGAKMLWQSEHPQVDEGWQEIIASEGQDLIKIQLVFGNDTGGGTVHYRLHEVAGGTEVTWQYDSDFGNNPFGRYIGLMMDNMLGPYYESGLKNLKNTLEIQQPAESN